MKNLTSPKKVPSLHGTRTWVRAGTEKKTSNSGSCSSSVLHDHIIYGHVESILATLVTFPTVLMYCYICSVSLSPVIASFVLIPLPKTI